MPTTYPCTPGHEIIGDVAAVGDGVSRFKPGDRVGGPWHGGKEMLNPLSPYKDSVTNTHMLKT